MRRCSDENIPLWARRERARLQDLQPPEEPTDVTDWSLPRLFQEEEPETPQDLADATDDDVTNPDFPAVPDMNVPDLTSVTPSSQEPQPSTSTAASLPPSKRSGRQRRYPNWLRDYVTQLATSPAHH